MELVSILMPSFNTERFIVQAIASVVSQTYPYWELLVVDDGSSDGSVEKIRQFGDERIKVFAFEENRGPDFVRNFALEKASGRFIAFLDSDDTWEATKLEKQVAFMKERQIVFSYTPYFVIDEQGLKTGAFMPKTSIAYRDMLRTCDIGNSTVMYDAQALGKNKSGNLRHDYELWLQILKQGVTAHCVSSAPPPITSEPIASIRIRKGSDTYNKTKSAKLQWRVYREVEHFSLFKSLFYFSLYVFYGIKKRFAYFGGVK